MSSSPISLQRSKIMSAIGSRNTRPEMLVRRALYRAGFRFRLHDRALPGCPDLVLKKYGAIIDVRGCFWHAHTCSIGHQPKTNMRYWTSKLAKNVDRDIRNESLQILLGYRVTTVWECEIATDELLANKIFEIAAWLESGQT